VTEAQDQPVAGAVVQLKNTKTLQVRSFITQEDAIISFTASIRMWITRSRPSPRALRARCGRLSAFDSRKKPVINLKIEGKSRMRVGLGWRSC